MFSSSMKLFLVFVLTISATLGQKNCKKGADSNSLKDETCTGEVSSCTSPMFVEYTGISSQAYGCGHCGDAKDKTCKECTATDTPCNTAVSAPAEAKTFECYRYIYDDTVKEFKAVNTATTCHAEKNTAVKCNSPGEKAGATYTQQHGGCGPCAAGKIDDKTCMECGTTGCNKILAKCNKGTYNNTLTEEFCSGDIKTCKSPMFAEYTGMSSQAYGCGTCDGAAKDKTCKECTAAEGKNPCNTAVTAPADAQKFDCYAYTYNATNKKFTAAKTATTCHALKGTAIKCNSPGEKADAAYKQENGGCGPCAKGKVDDKTCSECDKTGCNSSATTFAFLSVYLYFMAVFFNLV